MSDFRNGGVHQRCTLRETSHLALKGNSCSIRRSAQSVDYESLGRVYFFISWASSKHTHPPTIEEKENPKRPKKKKKDNSWIESVMRDVEKRERYQTETEGIG